MHKILIIEDDPAYQKILKDSFEKERFEVIISSSAKGAILQTSQLHPDIILLDIMLPGGMNGFDFLEQLRADDSYKNIPVIIITNIASEEKVAREIGVSFYFVKSDTTIPKIIKKVNEILT